MLFAGVFLSCFSLLMIAEEQLFDGREQTLDMCTNMHCFCIPVHGRFHKRKGMEKNQIGTESVIFYPRRNN